MFPGWRTTRSTFYVSTCRLSTYRYLHEIQDDIWRDLSWHSISSGTSSKTILFGALMTCESFLVFTASYFLSPFSDMFFHPPFRSTMTRYHLINEMCRGREVIVHEILDDLRACLGKRLRRVLILISRIGDPIRSIFFYSDMWHLHQIKGSRMSPRID